jgi:hypothetical protein
MKQLQHFLFGLFVLAALSAGAQVATRTTGSVKPGNKEPVTTRMPVTGTCNFKIGQNVAALGGYIFYLDSTGCHGLVCDTIDNSTGIQWYYGAFTNTGTFASAVGAGNSNTTTIVIRQGVDTYAAKLCYDLVSAGFTDWYLPSKYELNLMHTNIGRAAPPPNTNIGNFASDFYWSSSELDLNFAWAQYFLVGNQFTDLKNHLCRVRAVRAF